MIPTYKQALSLLRKYNLQKYKTSHSKQVAKTAKDIATKISSKHPELKIDVNLVEIAALLHDIDSAQNIKKTGDHGKIAKQILEKEGIDPQIAKIALTHPVDAIIDPARPPTSLEEKIVAYADKLVKKDKITTLDKRFQLWLKEDNSKTQQQIFKKAYPEFKKLEKELISLF